MTIVFIPTALRAMTNGCESAEAEGATLGEVLAALDMRFPGIKERLTVGERVAPWLSVVIDGSLAPKSLFTPIGPGSEVHFLPAISGGSPMSSSVVENPCWRSADRSV